MPAIGLIIDLLTNPFRLREFFIKLIIRLGLNCYKIDAVNFYTN